MSCADCDVDGRTFLSDAETGCDCEGEGYCFYDETCFVRWRVCGRYVVKPRKPFIVKPAIMHFISLMPLPAA